MIEFFYWNSLKQKVYIVLKVHIELEPQISKS